MYCNVPVHFYQELEIKMSGLVHGVTLTKPAGWPQSQEVKNVIYEPRFILQYIRSY
jgi:hypothetical protein